MRLFLAAVMGALVAQAGSASAFCGFYVSGASTKLYNNATEVVMMRDGARTVLAMQNSYQGPPENFAMVVPVPVVLQKENVKTLTSAIFDKVDTLAAPRLVEYWEQDPCRTEPDYTDMPRPSGVPQMAPRTPSAPPQNLGVKIEAQFTVGEYEIVILSATDSTGLDKWLKLSGYHIPDGSEPYLRPYVEGGSKFFVAKVDIKKVTLDADGKALLSPLRFHFDSDTFSLPIRLGLVNAKEAQDLIVHILARGQRYEVANYDNVTIPTNLDVSEKAKDQFASFYATLFDATVSKHPKAVVTEYSWDSNSCDPCPIPALQGSDLATLGGDALPTVTKDQLQYGGGFVLTRLHARYTKDTLGEDLVFRAAPPIMGGRGQPGQENLNQGAQQAGNNNFQGRYIIKHPWTGKVDCPNPRRGVWGGPPGQNRFNSPPPPPVAAKKTADAPRGTVTLATFVTGDIPDVGYKAAADPSVKPQTAPESGGGTVTSAVPPPTTPTPAAQRGCACNVGDHGAATFSGFLVLLLLALGVRRRD